jgi:hypothetical protein
MAGKADIYVARCTEGSIRRGGNSISVQVMVAIYIVSRLCNSGEAVATPTVTVTGTRVSADMAIPCVFTADDYEAAVG